jgi:outer membrane protein W
MHAGSATRWWRHHRGDSMKLKAQSRVWMALAALGGAFMAAQPVMAQSQLSNLFANASPSVRDRMFMRLDYIRANVKTTAGDVKDVTGAVVTPALIRSSDPTADGRLKANTLRDNIYGATNAFATTIGDVADSRYACEGEIGGLGTPCGIRAKSQTMIGTPALSLGYFVDDEFSWAVEAFVLAKPIDVTIKGDGANHLNGKDIIKLKFLPPTVTLAKYFGAKSDRLRPFVGVMGSYGIFYDTKATDYLNSYQGGGNPGDTSIKINNVLGWGGVVGVKSNLTDDWSINLSVGKLRYKTEANVVTRNTTITKDSEVLLDYGGGAQAAIGALDLPVFNKLMCKVAYYKKTGAVASSTDCDGTSSGNQGTYVRRASNILDSTLFVLSVGRAF